MIRAAFLFVVMALLCAPTALTYAQKAAPKAAAVKAAPAKAAKAPPAKRSRLDPKAVAANELLDKRFLTPYKAGIDALNKNQPDLAIKHAQVAISRRANSGRAQLLLATAYKAKNLYSSAIQYYKQAAKNLSPKSALYEGAQALYNVALCYELLRQHPNAIAAWQIYVNYANNYTMRKHKREHALKRIKALQSVKGPPK